MAISFVGAAWALSSSVTVPTHQAGDLIIIFAARPAGSVGLVAGWTLIYEWDGGAYGDVVIAYKFATAPGTTSGTWNYATRIGAAVYRGVNGATPVGVLKSSENFSSPTGYFPSLNGMQPQDSWVVAASFAETTHPTVSGLTARTTSNQGRLYDSNGVRTSWNGTVYNLGATRDVVSVVFEIRGGEQKSTAGAVSLAIDTPGTDVKSAAAASLLSPAWIDSGMNGSFETDLAGWQSSFFGDVYAVMTRDTTKYRSGVASLRAEARQDMDGDTVYDRARVFHYRVFAYRGARYRATGWVWFDTSVTSWYFGSFLDGSMPMTYGSTTGEWVQVQTEGVALSDQFLFEVVADGINPVFWVDDVTVEWYSDALGVWLDVDGEVVKAQGEIKNVTSDVTLETLLVSGFTGATLFTNSGLTLDLGAAGVMEKAANIAGATSLGVSPAGVPSKHVNRAGAVALGMSVSGLVSRGEDNLGGLLTRLVAYTPNGASLGPLPGAQSWTVTIPYGADGGAFDCEYPVAAPRSDVIAAPVEVALELHDGTRFVEPWDCRWLILNRDSDEADPAAVTKATGVSMGFHLSKTYVADGPTDGSTPGERRFTSATAGRIMATFSAEAKARGALAGVDVSTFSATTDSAGRPWSLIMSLGFEVGVPMSSVVEALVQQGMMEVRWDKRKLLLFDAETSSIDRTVQAKPVILTQGRDVKSAPVSAVMGDVATVALVRGDEGLNVEVTNGSATSPWGRWETTLDQGGVTDADALETAGAATLSRVAVGREQHTHALSFVGVQAFPLLGYTPGDWLWSAPGMSSANKERYRLQQITLSYGNDGVTSGSVILNDRLVEQDVKTKKRLDGVQGGASNAGPRPRPAEGDSTTPAAPSGLVASTSVYLDEKVQRAQVTLTWNDPTVNTDGTPLTDLNMVQVWAKPSRAGMTWRLLTAVPAGQKTVAYSPLEAGVQYQFRVNAIDFTGHASADSNTVTLNTAADTSGPPQPAAPTTDARNGVVEITFSGQTNTGAEMPIDFSHVEVYAHTSSSFATTGTTYRRGTIAAGKSSLTLTNWPYNTNVYARLVAVDVVGNKSAVSPVSAAVYNGKVDSGDIANDAVGPGQVDVPALDSAGNLDVNQLNGKTITGVTINGGIFRSTNSNQRVEMGDTGPNDSVDEIRMFNGGRVSSIRNPSDRTGWTRLSTSSSAGQQIFDFGKIDDSGSNAVIHVPGRAYLKFLASSAQVQVRNSSDSGYQPIVASAFTVASERQFKNDITPSGVDATAAVKATRAKRWKWNWNADTDAAPRNEMGLIADELPDEVRHGDGYSVSAVVALLWDALRDAHERIDALEKRPRVP